MKRAEISGFVGVFHIFINFYFFQNAKKSARVGGFKLGLVGEPETHLFFCFGLSKNPFSKVCITQNPVDSSKGKLGH